ncbi:hypothetical protein ACFPZI_26355 [Streptomyces chlorus]|uniref:Uncharacterized protein n=1 Tax=Streptomyces chlorus TaxID=887452 RepID=A0ABW1E2V0_9ACTN
MTGSTSASCTTPGAEPCTAPRTAADDAAPTRTERAEGETVIVD